MAQGFEGSEGVELNLTPLIDCVFLLLVFFMVTTIFTSSVGLQIELPEAENWQQISETKMFLSIDEDGRMELNSRVVTKTSLASMLSNEKRRTRSVTLIVKADREARHEYTLDIMEIAKSLGVETISLAVDKPEDTESAAKGE